MHVGSITRATAGFMGSASSDMNAQSAEEHFPHLAVQNQGSQGLSRRLLKGKTPVSADTMSPWLDIYPNREAAELLKNGFMFGFYIPFVFLNKPIFSSHLKSASENPNVLRVKIQTEVNLGRVEGPFTELTFSNLRVSPLCVVPIRRDRKILLDPPIVVSERVVS